MLERQKRCVKSLSIQSLQGGSRFWIQPPLACGEACTVSRVSQERVADMRQMNPDLVRPSRLQRNS